MRPVEEIGGGPGSSIASVLTKKAALTPSVAVGSEPDMRIRETELGPVRLRAEGPLDAPTILLLHGWGASLDWWSPVAGRLTPRYRVIRFDLPGHGASADWVEAYDIATCGQMLARLLEEEAPRGPVTVVGQSLGGLLAIEAAVARPAAVDRLVLIDTPPALHYRRLPLLARLSLAGGIGPRLRALAPRPLVRRSLRMLVAPGAPVPDNAVDGVRRLSWHAYAGWNAAIERYLETRGPLERLRQMAKPTLVIWGAQDRFWAPEALTDFAALPEVETLLVPEAGHSAHIEAPEATAREIERFASDRGSRGTALDSMSQPLREQ